jgi:hypothetical protein
VYEHDFLSTTRKLPLNEAVPHPSTHILHAQTTVHDLRYVSDSTFATCGLNNLHFWTVDKKSLRRTRGIFGRKVTKQVGTRTATLLPPHTKPFSPK